MIWRIGRNSVNENDVLAKMIKEFDSSETAQTCLMAKTHVSFV